MFEGLLQPMHLLVIVIIALIVFGPGKLGDIGGQLGRALREFKKAVLEPDTVEPTKKPAVTDRTEAAAKDPQ